MLRGSRPGERRGGRVRGTPNRRSILRDRILAVGSDHPAASQRAFLRKLFKDVKLPGETRIAIAPQCFPPKGTRSSRTSQSRALAASPISQTPALVPAMRDWNPKALEALVGVVQDSTANPKARRKAALKIAEYLLPKVPKKPKVLPDEFGFLVSPKLASAYRDIQLELRDRGAFAIANMCGSSLNKLAWFADVSLAMPITCASRRTARSTARSATSSRCRSAGDIIVSFIVMVMKQDGGKNSGLIRPVPPGRCG
jgi:hypothetical protein